MSETIKNLLSHSINKLLKTSSTPQLDAEVLLSYVLKKPREYVLIHPEKKLTLKQVKKFNDFIKRRLNYEPIAYILGKKEFYGLNFKVTRDTLILRPETEHLVDAVISNSQLVNSKKTIIADIGTGSGNIIISLAKNIQTSNVHNGHSMSFFGIDISKKALTVAKHNAKKNNVDDKIKFLRGNLLEPIIKNINCYMFHASCSMIIVANLPYLSKKIYSSCAPNVKKFEPRSALISGIDGLDHYEKLFQQITLLRKKCFMLHACLPKRQVSCFMEISPEQKQKITKLIKKYFPNANIEFQKDLTQKWRVAIFEI
ncbi:MAG: peptide chain release factor N(5)-glutamine methyltransferase [Candidatus Moraniibacteriota bacterium]